MDLIPCNQSLSCSLKAQSTHFYNILHSTHYKYWNSIFSFIFHHSLSRLFFQSSSSICMQEYQGDKRKKNLYQTIFMIAYHYSWLHGWKCICAQKRQTQYAINTSCYCKFSSFSHILKCHSQSLPALIHHVNLMPSSRAIHQSLTIALFCSCTHYQRVLAACHKHSVFCSQSGRERQDLC